MSELNKIALKILSNRKGILAADESNGTMTKRLESINVKSSPENRLKFREILFSSEEGMKSIGGVILYDETIRQTASSGEKIPELINSFGSVPGIKVDTGAKRMVLDPTNSLRMVETITEGLDGLRERLEEYYELGARFTKWRAVININKCYEVTSRVLQECYRELKFHNVDLKGTILKPNMILPGDKSSNKSDAQEIAKMTLKCLKENVPSEVPGIAFLSGGQSEIEATQNLNEINKINDTNFIISFSYGRALQQGALKSWGKDQKDILHTQKIFSQRSRMNGLASTGQWLKELETE